MNLIRPGLAALSKMNEKMAAKAATRPFYSAVDKAITEITAKQPKGTGDQYLAMIMKTKGVKPAEIKDRGLDVALKGKGKTTGEELQKLADENPPPQVKERVLDNSDGEYDDDGRAVVGNPTHYGPNEYDDYHTPGGTNYREQLFHLPMPKLEKVKPKTLAELQQEGYTVKDFEYDRVTGRSSYKVIGPDGEWVSQRSGASGVSVPEQALIDYGNRQAQDAAREADKSKVFRSGHFGEEGKQLVGHGRVQDMIGPKGEKMMVIDEIQSDWHQAGRKKGYGVKDATPLTPDEDSELMALYDVRGDRTVQETARMHELNDRLNASLGKGGVPDAPFKKNWHELVMKRLVDDAVKGGYDRIIFPPGAEQARRYGIEELGGMEGFYDKIMPNYIKNQYGIEVGQHPLKIHNFDVVRENRGDGFVVVRPGGGTVAKYPTIEEAQAAADQMSNVNYHSFDITPEMRESITTQGQPLYQAAPVAGAVGAGMMATSEEPEPYKKGGAVQKPVSMDAMRLATLNKQRK